MSGESLYNLSLAGEQLLSDSVCDSCNLFSQVHSHTRYNGTLYTGNFAITNFPQMRGSLFLSSSHY